MTPVRGFLTMLVILVGEAGVCRAWADETFDSNGVKINYSVKGKGEPVILIHGWLSSGWINWDLPGTTSLLAKDHRVIWLDMPAHGRSDKPTKDEAYGPELVEHVIRLMDHLKIKKAHIVGYSMGGIMAETTSDMTLAANLNHVTIRWLSKFRCTLGGEEFWAWFRSG
jgi:poly(3-hydroxyalkanoate) synthetase